MPEETDRGDVIRKRRKELGLTQKELSEKAGIGEMTLARMEAGKGHPKLINVNAVLDALGLPRAEAHRLQSPSLKDCVSALEFYIKELRKMVGP